MEEHKVISAVHAVICWAAIQAATRSWNIQNMKKNCKLKEDGFVTHFLPSSNVQCIVRNEN